jgi:NAD(P)H-flavin reductase
MKTQLKVNKKSDMVKRTYPAIQLVTEKFEHYLPDIANSIENLTQIYICGPPAMNSQLVKCMDTLNVPIEKYTIL